MFVEFKDAGAESHWRVPRRRWRPLRLSWTMWRKVRWMRTGVIWSVEMEMVPSSEEMCFPSQIRDY